MAFLQLPPTISLGPRRVCLPLPLGSIAVRANTAFRSRFVAVLDVPGLFRTRLSLRAICRVGVSTSQGRSDQRHRRFDRQLCLQTGRVPAASFPDGNGQFRQVPTASVPGRLRPTPDAACGSWNDGSGHLVHIHSIVPLYLSAAPPMAFWKWPYASTLLSSHQRMQAKRRCSATFGIHARSRMGAFHSVSA